MPTLFAATADCSSGFGTNWETTACQAGAVSAEPTETRKLEISKLAGPVRCSQTNTANAIEVTVYAVSPAIRKRRRSTMSTSAPAGIAKRNIGSVFDTWTIETVRGVASRLTISQPVATLYIQAPISDTTVASQMIANVRCVNGAQAGTAVVPVGECCDSWDAQFAAAGAAALENHP